MVSMIKTSSTRATQKTGFTLIELSIVLVVIGLLVGGILGGQSLIRSSELQSVLSDLGKYKSAITQFKDQYGALPGDLADASSYFTGATNGDGDGQLDSAAAVSVTGENFEFWKQLVSASLLVGNYSGNAGSGGVRHAVVGTNVPASRISKTGFGIEYLGTMSADLYRWNGDYGHAMYVGSEMAANPPEGEAFKVAEMWNLDTKVDDGKPATGNFRPRRKNSSANCTTTDVEATANYNLTYSDLACNIMLITGY